MHKSTKDGKNNRGNSGVNLGSNSTFNVQIVPSSDGGGIVTWIETGDMLSLLHMAKINVTRNIFWKKNVFTPRSDKSYFLPNKLISDGKDGVYIVVFPKKHWL